jgi:choline kinase
MTPKPLIELGGRPLISFVLEEMRLAGFSEIFVVVSEGERSVQQWLERYGRSRSMDLHVLERPARGTLDAVVSLIEAAGAPLLISTCDVVCPKGTLERFMSGVTSLEPLRPLVVVSSTSLIRDDDPIWLQLDPKESQIALDIGKHLVPTATCFGNFRWVNHDGALIMCAHAKERVVQRDSELLGRIARDFVGRVRVVPCGDMMDVDNVEDLQFARSKLSAWGLNKSS